MLILACKTVGDEVCEIPFQYKGKLFATCINVDNGGRPWCFTDAKNNKWNICDSSSCPGLGDVF